MLIYLVRPQPPLNERRNRTPVPEAYRYDWEPINLKLLAYFIQNRFNKTVRIKIWHLMNPSDSRQMLAAAKQDNPEIFFFSEIDVYVNEMVRLAGRCKNLNSNCWTVAGGKHSTLLKPGDPFPFPNVDYCIKGDGCVSAPSLIQSRIDGLTPKAIPGVVWPDKNGFVVGSSSLSEPVSIMDIDGPRMRSIPVEGRTLGDYFRKHQEFPSWQEEVTGTASIFSGSGCMHRCTFCQSPMERMGNSSPIQLRPPQHVAAEIGWLKTHYGVNNFFSLEPNLSLENLEQIYAYLDKSGLLPIPVSGFVRAADVVSAGRSGLLSHLVQCGMRILSIGLDIPPDSRKDLYGKAFSYQTQEECLHVCRETGIVVLATSVASPDVTEQEFAAQLAMLENASVASVDIRIAIALKNTPYYDKYKEFLIHSGRTYFDRQNYRYQTIKLPGKITPSATYRLIRDFQKRFLFTGEHIDYVLHMLRNHRAVTPFFQRQYDHAVKDVQIPHKRAELMHLLQPGNEV